MIPEEQILKKFPGPANTPMRSALMNIMWAYQSVQEEPELARECFTTIVNDGLSEFDRMALIGIIEDSAQKYRAAATQLDQAAAKLSNGA